MISGSGGLGLAREYVIQAKGNADSWRARLAGLGRTVTPEMFLKCQGMIAMHEHTAALWQAEIDAYLKEMPE